jgi:hypothetical protein
MHAYLIVNGAFVTDFDKLSSIGRSNMAKIFCHVKGRFM